ncbi:heavy metal translocating P-type ATPase [Rivihabitans pingtungensis]|uniref:heavy metal translocating P-type ATPase n=1 Tax=Rivihabitans pingtungensis TaxID=1054498 RepID=UPI002C1B3191|nr:heavy metal translocating P-type ATPase [Rivihabitans pingtungensis]HNX71478.1 heavy metal translocating P-type ATPase [Rivihabitans pingtungensis]
MTPPILTLPIAGMTCAACAVRLEKVLKRLPDVDAEVNFATASARLTSRTVQPPDLAAAMAAVARAGFQVPLSRQRLTLEGMTCAACAQRIEKVLNRLPGVHASVNFATASAEVDYPAGVVSSAQLLDTVRRAGYQAQLPRTDAPVTAAGEQDHTGRWLLASTLLALPFVAEMLAMLAGRHGLLPVAWQWALATPVQFLVGWRFYRGAWLSLRGGGANMDVLVALGTSMAYLLSVWTALTAPHHGHVYFEASVSVITLVLLGKWLEQRARRQTAGAIEALLKLAPTTARVERDGAVQDVPVAEVRVGEVVWVREGESAPVDGVVIDGQGSVDESLLTGESAPVSKGVDSPVYAATRNLQGVLRLRATGVGADTQLAAIIRQVGEAQGSKAPIQRLADVISGYFVPAVLAIAVATLLAVGASSGDWERAIMQAVAVLVIACPCALGLATPAAVMVGVGLGARHGVLFRHATALEHAGRLTVLAVDKTGTLTEGRPQLTEVIALAADNREQALALAASLEAGSEHPLAAAILRAAQDAQLGLQPVEAFSVSVGQGVSGVINGRALRLGVPAWVSPTLAEHPQVTRLTEAGHTVAALADETQVLALLALSDAIRPSAAPTIARLRAMGVEVHMLTGDNPAAAARVAKALDIRCWQAGVRPDGKARAIAELQARGERVGMAGDGVNDAPALAQADVSLAMGGGSHVAIETADITLMHGDLLAAADAIDLSRRTLAKIRQNLFFAFIYNILGIPLAALGGLNPVIAGAAMAMSSVSVVSNALLLRRWRPGR